jgi:hypothetical protein
MSEPAPSPQLRSTPECLSASWVHGAGTARRRTAGAGTADAFMLTRSEPSRTGQRLCTLLSPLALGAAGRKVSPCSPESHWLRGYHRVGPKYPSILRSWHLRTYATREAAPLWQSATGGLALRLRLALAACERVARERDAHGTLVNRAHAGRAPAPGAEWAQPPSRPVAGRLQLGRLASGPKDAVQSLDLRAARAGRLPVSGFTDPARFAATGLLGRANSTQTPWAPSWTAARDGASSCCRDGNV